MTILKKIKLLKNNKEIKSIFSQIDETYKANTQ